MRRDKKLMAGNAGRICTGKRYGNCQLKINVSVQTLHLNSSQQYDYIIAGAGCAGLSLAVHLIQSGQFSDKKILIADRDRKEQNDRTWSFWETKTGIFEPIVYRSWSKTWFHSKQFSRLLDLSPATYKMIRGVDFYAYCLDLIHNNPISPLFTERSVRSAMKTGRVYCIVVATDTPLILFSAVYYWKNQSWVKRIITCSSISGMDH
ncbi:MAG: hypothetical protein IPP99_12345 [Chitinophagaceae bacterium]|nr:hypothetical protein [Chitinophagaceae bacterium]